MAVRRHTARDEGRRSRARPPALPRRCSRRYLKHLGATIVDAAQFARTARRARRPEGASTQDAACVVVQHPNFFGGIEDLAAVAEVAHAHGALLIVERRTRSSLGVLQAARASCGADIAVGEGQRSASPMSFGGPYARLLRRREGVRPQMPGRLVGETVDADGKRGFVLTLQTREQHIRREKATSQHLHQPGAVALLRDDLPRAAGQGGLRAVGRALRQQGALRWRSRSQGPRREDPRFHDAVLQRVRRRSSPDPARR